MNIGIVCYPTFGGSGVVATELGKTLALRGHTVHFITYDWPVRLGRFTQNVTFHEVRMMDYPLFHFPPYESALTSAMVDVARYNDIDLFHVHYAIPHASAAFMAREILADMGKRVPVVTTLHGTDITLVGKNKSFEPVVSFSINHSDGVTAVSEYLRQATLQSFSINRDIEVIANFVDRERFFRQNKDHFRRIIASQNEKIIVHTSNFRKVKRTEDVISVFSKIVKELPARLLMIGDGPERMDAEALCRELGIAGQVVFLGNQNPVEEIYSVGDLFIMPSQTESFGLSALEAMACGMPVVTSNAGGLPEINLHGVTGYACEVGDIDEMANCALMILKDEQRLKTFSENAEKRAAEFTPEKIVPDYEAYYEKILQNSRR